MTEFRITDPNSSAAVARADHAGQAPTSPSDPAAQAAAEIASNAELFAMRRARLAAQAAGNVAAERLAATKSPGA